MESTIRLKPPSVNPKKIQLPSQAQKKAPRVSSLLKPVWVFEGMRKNMEATTLKG